MDNLEKAQKMARINLMQKIIKENNQSLEQMALELMAEGNNKTEIVQILTVRENLHPNHQKALEKILLRLF